MIQVLWNGKKLGRMKPCKQQVPTGVGHREGCAGSRAFGSPRGGGLRLTRAQRREDTCLHRPRHWTPSSPRSSSLSGSERPAGLTASSRGPQHGWRDLGQDLLPTALGSLQRPSNVPTPPSPEPSPAIPPGAAAHHQVFFPPQRCKMQVLQPTA